MYNLGHVNKMEGAENIPAPIKDTLLDNANSSLAYKTWAGTKTVLRLMQKCERATGVSLSLPWSPAAMATFVGWNIQLNKRDSTIKVYVSKVRKIHTMNGFPWQAGSSTLSTAAIKGRQKTQDKVGASSLQIYNPKYESEILRQLLAPLLIISTLESVTTL